MTGVPSPHPPEQLIAALIPASLPSRRPPPLPAIELPPLQPPTLRDDRVVLSTGRIDQSGRIPLRPQLRRWIGRPAHTFVSTPSTGGSSFDSARPASRRLPRPRVTVRAKIGLPVAARRMCGIEPGLVVVLAALVRQRLLVIHPAVEVVRLLRHTHARILGGRHDG
jgi:hypothetical protein